MPENTNVTPMIGLIYFCLVINMSVYCVPIVVLYMFNSKLSTIIFEDIVPFPVCDFIDND